MHSSYPTDINPGQKGENQSSISSTISIEKVRSTQRTCQRIQLQIPAQYRQEPIISTLVRRYDVEVNIQSALLASNAQESGWFDLELCGMPARIQQGLDYLAQLQVEIWNGHHNFAKDRPY